MIAELQDEITLLTPPPPLLNQKKIAADTEALWEWVSTAAGQCQAGIFSIEMLVYGGLLPSRLHQATEEELLTRLFRLRELKEAYPTFKIYAGNLIMRTPHYNSSEEEPDYYEEYGERIFQWAWLKDKASREGLEEGEEQELQRIDQEIPEEVITDYSQRREKNVAINKAVIQLVKEGVIEFLSIPQDDSAPYGFTALDQKAVVKEVIAQRLQTKVHMYPGADEVGCTLLARAYQELTQQRTKVYVYYSSVHSAQIIPMYEDRPLGESLKAHILATNALMVDRPEEADIILAVNTAGKVMMEAWDQEIKDITYSTFRNLRSFVDQIKQWTLEGKKVAVADVAFANGGETELIQLLDDMAAWDDVLAYAGWNTNCNTIGTVLSTAIIGKDTDQQEMIDKNKIYHLLEGWAYQSEVRMKMVKEYLPTLGASYYDFNGQEATINIEMESRIRACWTDMMQQSFQKYHLEQVKVYSPWHRMFEIGIDLRVGAEKE
ncbi:DUF4127 family protein [Algivirga pacifica]|uniref:DUF4127 family protein n=2 Tax=Algivirga pacifica TaxID=1162670 RepID=A0ABP9DAJ1_9BACT